MPGGGPPPLQVQAPQAQGALLRGARPAAGRGAEQHLRRAHAAANPPLRRRVRQGSGHGRLQRRRARAGSQPREGRGPGGPGRGPGGTQAAVGARGAGSRAGAPAGREATQGKFCLPRCSGRSRPSKEVASQGAADGPLTSGWLPDRCVDPSWLRCRSRGSSPGRARRWPRCWPPACCWRWGCTALWPSWTASCRASQTRRSSEVAALPYQEPKQGVT